MDLYLMSPVFLRKMLRSSAGKSSSDGLLEMDSPHATEDDFDDDDDYYHVETENTDSDSDREHEAMAFYYRRGTRRRSSLDRMLRQHAYIIICLMCYAWSVPGLGT